MIDLPRRDIREIAPLIREAVRHEDIEAFKEVVANSRSRRGATISVLTRRYSGRPSASAVGNGGFDSVASLRFGNGGEVAFNLVQYLMNGLVVLRLGICSHS
jgi:hypothetical protein